MDGFKLDAENPVFLDLINDSLDEEIKTFLIVVSVFPTVSDTVFEVIADVVFVETDDVIEESVPATCSKLPRPIISGKNAVLDDCV